MKDYFSFSQLKQTLVILTIMSSLFGVVSIQAAPRIRLATGSPRHTEFPSHLPHASCLSRGAAAGQFVRVDRPASGRRDQARDVEAP